LSSLSGAHDYLFPRVANLFKEKNMNDVLILGGGIIPEEDVPSLKEAGVTEIFGPGTRTDDIVNYIKTHVGKSV
jgi:methylmalonyl-CoA mutase C-terminal domain/subunit